ncbi:OLC1v1014146C1 [Oldenlandia corymbosa var. corymbosa]|uniref:non-specific serine/threonine protein kinase n=1 Tax=Oldenlandia corymbosa var. corymbosa TaxID=529605 RepID=A0AAV1E0E3_OLDCO|nr:OLC1v1014146C1 [Oldenlandia corymbosa var. corymbosa]
MTNLQLMMLTIIYVIVAYIICCNVNADEFGDCSRPYNCGSLRGIGYPFFGGDRPGYCGRRGYGLICVKDQYSVILIGQVSYRLLEIDASIPKMRIARQDLLNDICPESWVFFDHYKSFDFKFNDPSDNTRNLRIYYGCSPEVISRVQTQSNVSCSIENEPGGVFFTPEVVPVAGGCKKNFVVPLQLEAYDDLWARKITLEEAVNQGFDVQYAADLAACSSCQASGGKCGSDSRIPHVHVPFLHTCREETFGEARNWYGNVRAAATAVGILIIISYFCGKSCLNLFLSTRKSENDKELEAFIKQNDSLKPRRYSYHEIKRMTNQFKEKIGQGGYGEVYRGNLPSGCLVAVKILNSAKENGEEFINEISSISKTSHVNVVTLLGYCLDGSKRALVYEFMPNGSLEKHINPGSDSYLGLERLYEIAVGIAKGLEYLHGGCNTRILHFDIKPHNILLDEDFFPKISDFGLAKLCAPKESIVSMLGTRGTIGYIAPEVFSRNFGKVSYKSDVYSYGMMVLEMIVGRNATNAHLNSASETYFPDWIYDHIKNNEELNLQDQIGMTEKEKGIARRMIIVGLWCIQTSPLQRPTMNKVIDMLEGDSKSLEVPPKPLLSSSSRAGEVNLEISMLQSRNMPSFSRSNSYC